MDMTIPPLGENIDSGTVVTLLVKEGDSVAPGQPLIEVETGKAVAPIPAVAAGVVSKILVKEGQKIAVGAPFLSLSGGGTSVAAKPAAPAKPVPTPAAKRPASPPPPPAEPETPAEPGETAGDDDFQYTGQFPPPAAPSLRRLAHDLGIDLRKVRGSEPGGRIVMADVKNYIGRLQKIAEKAAAAAKTGTPLKIKAPLESVDFSRFGPIYKRPMTPLRKVIATRMADNWNTIPHVTQFDEVDLTGLMALRKQFAGAYEKKGAKLTVTSFALKAVVAALKKHPVFNASLDEVAEEIIFKEHYHIGLAVDTEQGLIVPVLRDVDKKSMLQLSREVQDLAERTRSRKVSPEELQGGTFTISNQGSFGGGHFTPIVNKPEVAILGLGKGALKPVVTAEKKIEARLVMPVALSYDHRVIDGGSAARFMVDLVAAFQEITAEETGREI